MQIKLTFFITLYTDLTMLLSEDFQPSSKDEAFDANQSEAHLPPNMRANDINIFSFAYKYLLDFKIFSLDYICFISF